MQERYSITQVIKVLQEDQAVADAKRQVNMVISPNLLRQDKDVVDKKTEVDVNNEKRND